MAYVFEEYSKGAPSGGLTIKEITFTDRPTLHNWLLENSDKILKVIVSSDEFDVPFTFTTVNLITEYDSFSYEFIRTIYEYDAGNVTLAVNMIRFCVGFTIIDSVKLGKPHQEMTLPDEYWAYLNCKVKIYYIE